MNTPRPRSVAHAPDPEPGLPRPVAPVALNAGRDELLASAPLATPVPGERRILAVAFDVFAVMGNAINQAHEPGPETPPASQIRVVGSAFMGEIRVLVRQRGA